MAGPLALAGSFAAVMGFMTFFYFIHEEAMQTRQMGIYILIKNEMWEEAQIQLNSLQEQLNGVISVHLFWGEFGPPKQWAFWQYFRAVQDQIDTYRALISKKLEELPPIEYGRLRVLSMPSEAEIYIDGRNTKMLTPETFKEIEPGTHTVKIRRYIPRLKRWLTKEEKVEVEVGKRVEILISLAEEIEALLPVEVPITTGVLRIASSPTGARIYLDGVDTDQLTPETFREVEAGTHTIRITRYIPKIKQTLSKEQTVTIAAEEEKELLISLTEEIEALIPVPPPITTSTLGVTSSPAGAKISINGVDTLLLTPETFKEMEAGTYTVKATRWMPKIKEFISKEETVTLEAGKKRELLIILEEA